MEDIQKTDIELAMSTHIARYCAPRFILTDNGSSNDILENHQKLIVEELHHLHLSTQELSYTQRSQPLLCNSLARLSQATAVQFFSHGAWTAIFKASSVLNKVWTTYFNVNWYALHFILLWTSLFSSSETKSVFTLHVCQYKPNLVINMKFSQSQGLVTQWHNPILLKSIMTCIILMLKNLYTKKMYYGG